MSCRAKGWAETQHIPTEQQITIVLHLYYSHLADARVQRCRKHTSFCPLLVQGKPSLAVPLRTPEASGVEAM